jgi:sarcosine oxidase subunit gamma
MPGQREIVWKDGRGLAWMSPDELLAILPYAEVAGKLDEVARAMGSAHHLAVDVSDARALFRLKDKGVREVVAKLCPVDMATFRPGEIRRTRMAQVPAAFWVPDDETVMLICFRSVAQYAFDLLKGAAAPGGEVGHF